MKNVLRRGSRLGMAGLGRNSNAEGALNTSMKGWSDISFTTCSGVLINSRFIEGMHYAAEYYLIFVLRICFLKHRIVMVFQWLTAIMCEVFAPACV